MPVARTTLALVAAALLLAGCGDSDDSSDGDADGSSSTAPSSTPTLAEPAPESSAPDTAAYPTEPGEVALPGNVRIAGLDLTCRAEPSEVGGTNGRVVIEGSNATDVDFGRLRINFQVTGAGAPTDGYTNLPAFLPGDELGYIVPTTVPEDATGCEVTSVEGTQPSEAPPVSFETEGATCTIVSQDSESYWNFEADVSGITDFPAGGANVSIAFLADGKIVGYQEPSLAAGETTVTELTSHTTKPTCMVKAFTLP